ncbi:MAG: hypothetical protein LIO43_04380 [Clostridiales bacterium]|nr:hypothetical protein [Clostridiales bacterium]
MRCSLDKSLVIKQQLERVGKKAFFSDGDWNSTPFYAVIEQRWKSNKSNFEKTQTEIGLVSADYFTYIGPYDHDVETLSDEAVLNCSGKRYIFKKKEKVEAGGVTQYFWGILRLVSGDFDD